jgi:hypothetical protein
VDFKDPRVTYRHDQLVRASDTRGVVHLRHVGFWMHTDKGSAGYQDLVALAVCLQPAVETPVDPLNPPMQPIVLRMPPTGEVELVYEEQDGTPIPLQGNAALVPSTVASDRADRLPLASFGTREAGAQVFEHPGSGFVVFPRVSLGAEWFVWAQRNVLSEPVRARVRGPQKEGERVRIVVRPPQVLALRGRLIDDAHQPRAGVEFCVQTRELPPSGGWGFVNAPDDMVQEGGLGLSLLPMNLPRMKSDEHGSFRIDCDVSKRRGGNLFLVFVESEGGLNERGCRVLLEKTPPARVVELGDLRFSPAPVIASGTIKDEEGHPLAQVSVGVSPVVSGGYRYATQSLADGSFRVLGVCLDKEVRLNFSRDGYTDATSGGPPGDMDGLEVVMEGAGRIRGRVRMPDGLDPKQYGVRWKRIRPEASSSGCSGSGSIGEEGRIELRDLPPGDYDVEITSRIGFETTSLITRNGVAVEAGKTVDFGEIEVPSSNRKITLRLLDANGSEPKTGWYGIRLPAHAKPDEGLEKMDPYHGKDLWKTLFRERLEQGTFSITTSGIIEQFEAAVPGCRFVHLEMIAADRTIELKRGLPVKLKLKKRVGAPLAGCTFHVGLVSKGEGPREPYFESLYRSDPFAADGAAVLLAPDPGTYWIQWIVERAGQGGSVARTQMDDRQQLVILDRDAEQVFELDPGLDPSKIDPSRK